MFVALNKAARIKAARPTDDFSKVVRAATLRAARAMRQLWSVENLERAIATRQSFHMTSDYRWRGIESQLSDTLQRALLVVVGRSGNAELERLAKQPFVLKPRHVHVRPVRPQILFKASEEEREDDEEGGGGDFGDDEPSMDLTLEGSFDLQNPYSLEFVRHETASLVSGITERARQQIKDAIERGFVEGIPVRETAQSIRATLGLDDRLARAVENQVNQLSQAGVSSEDIADRAAAYADRLLDYRATVIARTETMTASNHGILDSWRQASGEGLLPGGMLKQWIHAEGSARTCEICDELGESDPVPMFGLFYSSILDESFEAPPSHPQCRCTVGLVAPGDAAAE